MNKSSSVCYYSIKPFFRLERALSDVTRGRRSKMSKVYNLVMDSRHNPMSQIPDTKTRHFVMPVLACIWCVVSSMLMVSIVVFGVSEGNPRHTVGRYFYYSRCL